MRPANKKPVYLDDDEIRALREMRSRRRKKNGRRKAQANRQQPAERHPLNRDNLIVICLILIFLYMVLGGI